MKIKIIVFSVVVGLMILLGGCTQVQDELENGEAGSETSFVEFRVTDKVTEDFDHVNVTFSEIRLFRESEEGNDSYVTVSLGSKTVDLVYLNLSNINETLGVAEIEVGNYSKLWINVSSVTGVLNITGETVNITVPSGWLKINQLHLFNIQKGNNTITVDINLEDSIHIFHGGEEYKFIPSIARIDHYHENELKFREHNQSKIKNMVGNRAPVIDILVNGSLIKKTTWVALNESVEFNASATLDVDGDNLTFTWDFDDGDAAEGAVVNHSFGDSKNNYKVTLTVYDGTDEAIGIITINVHVNNKGGQG